MIARWIWHLGPGRRNRGWRPLVAKMAEVAALDAAGFEAWQADALARHLRWARASVPFYASLPESADTLADFPILTRAALQSSVDALCDATRPRETLRANASGGSTGEPVVVYQDAAYWTHEFALEAWLSDWWGVPRWGPVAYLWGDDLNPEDHTWKARLEARLAGTLSLNVFDVRPGVLDEFLARLRRRRPPILMGYASALDLFAEHLQANGGLGYTPALLRSAAEAVAPDRRARIEAGFGIPLTDFYGSRESASLASQWKGGPYYVMGHSKVIEIVDADDQPAPPGQPGRVLVTDLTNRAFGLIRYENGDIAAWDPAPPPADAPCAFPRITRIHGRTSDFISTPDGQRIHGEFFTHLFYGVKEVTRFQVRQEMLERLDVWTTGDADAAIMAPILDAIRAKVGPGMEVVWTPKDEIPLTRTGKHRFTVSAIPYRGASSS